MWCFLQINNSMCSHWINNETKTLVLILLLWFWETLCKSNSVLPCYYRYLWETQVVIFLPNLYQAGARSQPCATGWGGLLYQGRQIFTIHLVSKKVLRKYYRQSAYPTYDTNGQTSNRKRIETANGSLNVRQHG